MATSTDEHSDKQKDTEAEPMPEHITRELEKEQTRVPISRGEHRKYLARDGVFIGAHASNSEAHSFEAHICSFEFEDLNTSYQLLSEYP